MHLPWEVSGVSLKLRIDCGSQRTRSVLFCPIETLLKVTHHMQEYKESGSVEELADILEVLQGLVEQVHGMNWEEVRELQGRKWKERGGFRKGIVLERVEE